MRAAPLLLILVLVGCGAATDPSEPAPATAPADAQLYKTNATVLEDASHGPALCLGGMAALDVPQCGTVPITNWDWDAVAGEQANGAATWGKFYVVGTFDGKAVTVVEAGPVRPFGEDEPPGYYERLPRVTRRRAAGRCPIKGGRAMTWT
jgi:hypothetical protein